MMLQNKNAIICGAGGSLGGAVAKALAGNGATVFLAGRNLSSVKKVADEILASGGRAEAHQVDALNEKEIKDFINKVQASAGTVDISFSAIDYQVVQNIPLVSGSPKKNAHDLLDLTDIIEVGKLKTVIDRTYTLEQIREAHAYVEQFRKKGNVVIRVIET